MTKPASGNFNGGPNQPSGRITSGASAAQLIDHHENWVRDTFLWLPLKAKDATWSAVWEALSTRQRKPTHHDVLDALRMAALREQDRYRVIHDDVTPPTDSDED
ncbi:MAG: hypothetical protein I8H93_10680 [Pseudomonadales bacterium]|nr:hypothetical protein [Pseudomonadales bacterium]